MEVVNALGRRKSAIARIFVTSLRALQIGRAL